MQFILRLTLVYNHINLTFTCTGKSLSKTLIFASTNPQYDDRLFIELQFQYIQIPNSDPGENILCTEIVSDVQNNFCTQYYLPIFCKKKSFWQRFTCISSNSNWSDIIVLTLNISTRPELNCLVLLSTLGSKSDLCWLLKVS